MSLVETVRHLAQESGLSIPELAELSGCTEVWLKTVMTGFTKNPGIDKLTKLHDSLAAVPLNKLLEKATLKSHLQG